MNVLSLISFLLQWKRISDRHRYVLNSRTAVRLMKKKNKLEKLKMLLLLSIGVCPVERYEQRKYIVVVGPACCFHLAN